MCRAACANAFSDWIAESGNWSDPSNRLYGFEPGPDYTATIPMGFLPGDVLEGTAEIDKSISEGPETCWDLYLGAGDQIVGNVVMTEKRLEVGNEARVRREAGGRGFDPSGGYADGTGFENRRHPPPATRSVTALPGSGEGRIFARPVQVLQRTSSSPRESC